MDHFASVPRLSLGLYPTPLYLLKNISAKYGRNIFTNEFLVVHIDVLTTKYSANFVIFINLFA